MSLRLFHTDTVKPRYPDVLLSYETTPSSDAEIRQAQALDPVNVPAFDGSGTGARIEIICTDGRMTVEMVGGAHKFTHL